MARKVRVAAFTDMCEKKPRTVDDNLDWTCDILDRIAVEKPDIVCLSETFDTRETGLSHPQMGQPADGKTVSRMAAKAREHQHYIVCAFIDQRGDSNFNTALIIDPQGEIVGRYDKIHPTIGENEDCIASGRIEPTVIATDFGRIGCQICFDANWPQGWQAVKEAGAEIIFFPSAFSAGRILESLATIFHVPIVAACCAPCCRIIDRDGLVLNRQGVYQKWVLATLDLDSPLFHLDFQFEKMEAVRRAYGPDATIRVYEEEGWWRIIPRRAGLEVPDIINEFDLEPLEDYLHRSTSVQDAHRTAQDCSGAVRPRIGRQSPGPPQ